MTGMRAAHELTPLVEQLWRRGFSNESAAFASTEFRWLVNVCRERFCGPGAASEVAPRCSGDSVKDKFDMDLQRHEIERFFRFIGAPWYGGTFPEPPAVAAELEHAYVAGTTETFTLLPLDLIDGLAPVEFGPWRIREFSQSEFEQFIGLEKLRRSGQAFVPDVERLHMLNWLVLRREAMPWFQRSATIFNFDLSQVGVVDPFPRVFDPDVERGLFVLSLYPWEEKFSDSSTPWQPFRVPWTYTVSKHAFRLPPRAPDPEVLNWTLAGNPDEEPFEVPAVMHYFDEKDRTLLQGTLTKYWGLLNLVSPLGNHPLKAFNPLIEHFFLRGFLEGKIDQLIWHVTAIDAAVGKGAANAASTLARRVQALTGDAGMAERFKGVHYRRRSELVHGKHLTDRELRESDLADVRRAARTVVTNLIEFAAAHPDWSRSQMVHFLDSGKTV